MQIVYCHCAYARVIAPEVKTEVLQHLACSGEEWESVPDLCEMSARKDSHLAALAAQGGIRIAACYPRAVRSLFQAAGAPLSPEAKVLNMRAQPAAEVVAGLMEPTS